MRRQLALLFGRRPRSGTSASCCQLDGCCNIIDELVDRGVDFDSQSGPEGFTALMRAARLKDASTVVHLLVYGASVNMFSGNREWTALGCAVDGGADICCAPLVAAGADVNGARLNGAPAFGVALRRGRYKCLSAMLAAGADISAVDVFAFAQIETRHHEVQCLLVAAGASDCPVLFTQEELSAARAQIAVAKNEIDAARRRLKAERHSLVVKKALPMCIGLQSLELPAFVTLAIFDQVLPGRLSDVVSLHFKWDVITAVKHFHERRTAAAAARKCVMQ